MTIHYSIEGNLIYVAMIMLAAGLVLSLLRKIKWLPAVVFGAFVVLLAAWIRRWIAVGHLPMQTMFEVFLTLAMVLFPIGAISRRLPGIRNPMDYVGDVIIGLIILFPAGFVFSDRPQALPPILQSPLFGPHVLAYMLAYVLLAKAAMYAIMGCFIPTGKSEARSSKLETNPNSQNPNVQNGLSFENLNSDIVSDFGFRISNLPNQEKAAHYEQSAYLLACLGFPLMCLGLMLGSVWGVFAWGDWWNWDPKELWSLACVLMYALYFHWRGYFGQKFLRANCLLVILGFAFILITLLWVNFSRLFPGLHNYVG